jgi:hypothetical protein
VEHGWRRRCDTAKHDFVSQKLADGSTDPPGS